MINGLPANSFLVIQVFVWGCRRISPAHLALSSSIEAAKVPPHFPVWEKGHKDEETGSGGWWDHITPHLYHHSKSKITELAINGGTCSREFELFTKRSHGGDLRTWVRFSFLLVPFLVPSQSRGSCPQNSALRGERLLWHQFEVLYRGVLRSPEVRCWTDTTPVLAYEER